MKTTIENKVIWITGASSGIGEALAYELSHEGAKVIISARNEKHLDEVRERCHNNENVFVLPFDISCTNNISSIVGKAIRKWGRIDILVHNAGIVVRDMVLDTDMEQYRKIMETNYFGIVALTKEVLPHMIEKGNGQFVVLSSLCGKYGIPKISAYSASKHALHGFFESLRSEYHHRNIKVTMIIPGMINTGIVANGTDGKGFVSNKDHSINSRGISPELCAHKILVSILNNKQEAAIGGLEVMSLYVKRYFPALFSTLIRNHPVRRARAFSAKVLGTKYRVQSTKFKVQSSNERT